VSRLRFILVAALGATLAVAPAASAQKPEDVVRVESAVTQLAAAKRAAAGDVAANERANAKALLKCKSGGPGWKRIRSVRVAAQRALYTRGARQLWKDLNEVAVERAALDAYRPAFDRFLARFERPLADPVLQAGIDAWRKRIAFYEASTSFGTCRAFGKLLKRVRQFEENVRADYLAGDIYNKMVRFVPDSRRKAATRHWGSRYDVAIDAARAQLVALGGDDGYASYFSWGHSLRGA
jgi:hypothetical protein